MADKIKWGILGAGNIAHAFAQALPMSKSGELAGVASRSIEKAKKFLEPYRCGRAFASYDEMLADRSIDAVYIATPHPMHKEWSIKAAQQGKHILCEKPIAVNDKDAKEMAEVARENDVFLMEAFMYLFSEQVSVCCDLVRQKAIGELRLIKASFGFKGRYDLEGRLLNHALAGGGIMDVGCYPISMSRLLAGVATGLPYAEPLSLKGVAHIGEASQCDEWATATMEFQGGVLAQCSAAIQLELDNEVVLYGSEGKLRIPNPWLVAGKDGGETEIVLETDGKSEYIRIMNAPLYVPEIDAMAEGIHTRKVKWPGMNIDATLGNMKTLDMWREEISLVYPQDKI